jgi:hypothetical protein
LAHPLGRPLGLHCLLYLSADQICPPVRGRRGFAIEYRSSKKPWLARLLVDWEPAISIRMPWVAPKRVSVPCRPTAKVSPEELGSRLLMAALLECRDAGQLQLRLADSSRNWRTQLTDPEPSRVWVTPLASASVPGLCGRILETLDRHGEQGAKKLLRDMMGDFYEGWVVYQVEAELAALGYMKAQAPPRWRPAPEVQRFIGDCERIRTLEQECAQAVDRWRRVMLADQQLCDALLADCTDSITPHLWEE